MFFKKFDYKRTCDHGKIEYLQIEENSTWHFMVFNSLLIFEHYLLQKHYKPKYDSDIVWRSY